MPTWHDSSQSSGTVQALASELHEIEWEEARSMGPLPFFMSLKDLVRSLACTEGSHGEARMH